MNAKPMTFERKIGIMFTMGYLLFGCVSLILSLFAMHSDQFNNLLFFAILPLAILVWYGALDIFFLVLLVNIIMFYGLGNLIGRIFKRSPNIIIIYKVILGIVVVSTLSCLTLLIYSFATYDPGTMRTLYFNIDQSIEKTPANCKEIAIPRSLPSFSGYKSKFLSCEVDIDESQKDSYPVIREKSENNIYDCGCSHEMGAML